MTLAAAIAELLAASDGTASTPARRRIIDELLTRSPESRLDLSIKTIRAAVAVDPDREKSV